MPTVARSPMIRRGGLDDAMWLYLDEPPSANRWWRNVRGRMVLSREAREYKSAVSVLGIVSRVRPFPKGTPVRVSLTWHRSRKSGDLDKRLGVLLDALQGVAYENDSQIVEINARRDDNGSEYVFPVIVHVTPLTLTPAGGRHGVAQDGGPKGTP